MDGSRRITSRLASFSASTVCHPFLFSASAVLTDWLSNFDQVQPHVVIPPLLVSLLVAVGLYLPTRRVLKDKFLAGLLASVALFGILNYGLILDPLQSLPGAALLKWIPLAAVAVILAEILAVSRGHPEFPQKLNPILNLVSAVWVAMSVVPLMFAQLQVLSLRASYLEAHPLAETARLPDASDRDVYYIITDGYGRTDELLTDYDFDNSSFVSELRRMGFVVPECTLSNYAFTALSLPSSLNMQYVDVLGLSEPTDHPTIEYRELANAINYGEVQRRFERMGYKILTANNGIRWAQLRGADDINASGVVSNLLEYGYHFLSKTAFRLIPMPDPDPSGVVRYRRTLEVLDALQAIPEMDGPTFAFVHILAPHSPFVFGENGEYVRDRATSVTSEPDKYREQYRDEVEYLNGRLLEVLAAIIAESDTPPIIVVQGDHSWALSDRTQMQILNAYYLPDGGADRLYSYITPVNTFRLVFDYYFGEQNGVVEDRSYFSVYLHTPYGLEEYPANCAELPADRYPSLFSDTISLPSTGEWEEQRTRLMADVNGDGMSDIVGIGSGGVLVGLSNGTGFEDSQYWMTGSAADASWSGAGQVGLADVNGDEKSDLIGFTSAGVVVSRSTGTQFEMPVIWTRGFCVAEGWNDARPRLLGDVNGDGLSDIVGVAPDGVVVSLSNGLGFDRGAYWTHDFRADRDWSVPWPLLLGDVNGDGKSDLINLSDQGVYVTLSDGSAFGETIRRMRYAGLAKSWQDPWPLVSTDVDGDGQSDLLAFTPEGASVAISTEQGFLLSSRYWIWEQGGASDWPDPRLLIHGDIDGDGRSDVVGFGPDRLIVSFGGHR